MVPDLPDRDLHFRAFAGRVRPVRQPDCWWRWPIFNEKVSHKPLAEANSMAIAGQHAGDEQPAQCRGDRVDGHAAQPDGRWFKLHTAS
jgi:hypothetical protein